MKLALATFALLLGSSAFAMNTDPVPSEFNILGVTCTAKIRGQTMPVISSTLIKNEMIQLRNVRVPHQVRNYKLKFSASQEDGSNGLKLQVFATGSPARQGDDDTPLNDLYIEVAGTDGKSSRIAHGNEWLNLDDLKCSFDFAG